jgi:response regulator RpfG family c-di-GMP phosphodiesterase
MRTILETIKQGHQGMASNKLRRHIQSLADCADNHESLLVGLARNKELRGEASCHAAAVSIFALLLARKLGLDKRQQVELALAGVFHDLGNITLSHPSSVMDSPAAAPLEAFSPVQCSHLHTMVHLADFVIQSRLLERIVVAHEHTQSVSLKGADSPTMLARLIAVPCAFDLMTSSSLAKNPIAPDLALRLMLEERNNRFDKRIVKLFVSTVGFFPVGTTVKFNEGQIGVVIDTPKHPQHAGRPRVRVIRDCNGPVDFIVDLSRPEEKLHIVCALDSNTPEGSIPISHYLFT